MSEVFGFYNAQRDLFCCGWMVRLRCFQDASGLPKFYAFKGQRFGLISEPLSQNSAFPTIEIKIY